MQRYRIKLNNRWALYAVLAFLTITAGLNLALIPGKRALLRAGNAHLSQKISLKGAYFLPPCYLVLRDMRISPASPQGAQPLSLPWVVLKMKPENIFSGPRLSVAGGTFPRPTVHPGALKMFYRANRQFLDDLLARLPWGDISIKIKDICLDLRRPRTLAGVVLRGDAAMIIVNKTIEGQGSIRMDIRSPNPAVPGQYDNKQTPLFTCRLRAVKEGRQFFISEAVLQGWNNFIQLWGDLAGDRLRLKGFAFRENPPANTRAPQGFWRKLGRRRSAIRSALGQREGKEDGLYILDIDSRLVLSPDRIRVDGLRAEMNDFPVDLRGNISWEDILRYRLEGRVFPPGRAGKGKTNFQRADLKLEGNYTDGKLHSSGELNVRFAANNRLQVPVERLFLGLDDMTVLFDPSARLALRLNRCDLALWCNGNKHALTLQDVRTGLITLDRRMNVCEIRSSFYGGTMRGKVWTDSRASPPRISSLLYLGNVEANLLDGLLVHFSKVYGTMDSRIFVSVYPEFDLGGSLSVTNGMLKNFEFFNWLAEAFCLPSLKTLNFEDATADFRINPERTGLDDIRMRSGDVDIGGYFIVNKAGLVSSKLSLGFSRGLLEESPKFRLILKMFPADVRSLIFDFQLSGNQHSMNFQWLDSEYKRKIQERIPDFIERKIERSIDSSVTSPEKK